MEYKEYKLEELVKIKYGRDQKRVASPNGTIPIYGTGGFMGYATKALYTKPSVLIGRKGTIDKIRFMQNPFWTVDTLFYTEINENIILPKYFYYLLCLEDLSRYNEGTTIPSLRTETLNRIPLKIPSLEIQGKVLSVLNPIDDIIVYNTAINKNLEEQAQAIFYKYFIYISDVPTNWQEANLTNIAEYRNGLAMQKFRPQKEEKSLPVLKIKELRQGHCDLNSERCSLKIKPEYIIHDGDVIFSWSGSLLVDFWCGGTCGLNQHLFKVYSKEYEPWLYYSWTKYHLTKFISMAADRATTMGHIKRDALEQARVLIPCHDDYLEIGRLLQPLYDSMISNRVEIRKLSKLRDTLLPRLMSGELDVSNIEL